MVNGDVRVQVLLYYKDEPSNYNVSEVPPTGAIALKGAEITLNGQEMSKRTAQAAVVSGAVSAAGSFLSRAKSFSSSGGAGDEVFTVAVKSTGKVFVLKAPPAVAERATAGGSGGGGGAATGECAVGEGVSKVEAGAAWFEAVRLASAGDLAGAAAVGQSAMRVDARMAVLDGLGALAGSAAATGGDDDADERELNESIANLEKLQSAK
jgi:hypothetical protein